MALEQEIRELEQRFADAPESRLFLPLADALRRAGELERAVQICSQGLESYPDFTSARVLLGKCLAGLGSHHQAREVLEGVLSEDENNLEALRTLGQISLDEGEKDRAGDYLSRALALEPEDETLAAVLKDLDGQLPGSGAADAEEEQYGGGSGEVFITHTLGDLYRLQGHYQRAYEVYSRLLDRFPEDPSLAVKLEDVTARLKQKKTSPVPHETAAEGKAEPAGAGIAAAEIPDAAAAEEETVPQDRQAADEELSMDRRIDRIFASVLEGRESPLPEQMQSSGAGSFINMFERWIKGLRLLEAG